MTEQLENVLKFIIWGIILSIVTNIFTLLTTINIHSNIKELKQTRCYTEFSGEIPELPSLPY